MGEDNPAGGGLQVDLRDLPAMRIAALPYRGPADRIQATIDRLAAFVKEHGAGPAGPLEIVFGALNPLDAQPNHPIDAEIRLPITRLIEGAAVETRRIPSLPAACMLISQPLDRHFLQLHETLFAWLDARGLHRMGETHHHAYLGHNAALGHWTIEIRVPLAPRQTT